jgi:hypothetical protein
MDELIQGLVKKVGLDEATAKKVVAFLKENASQLPALLASNETAKSLVNQLPGGLGGMLGGLLGGNKDEEKK